MTRIAGGWKLVAVLAVTALISVDGFSAGASPHPGQSVNVVIIDSTSASSGGDLPTTTSGPTGSFADFTFTNLPVASVSAANLAAYDTAVLNVASSGMACDTATLSPAQKTDLVNFVSSGKKLVIYDSECSAVDYSWLPFPFNTSNPGAAGATGTFSIVENDTLGSNDPADSHYIDAALLASGTDAVGDGNVFTTFDPSWCVAQTGTNTLGVNGPLHTYATIGTGLVIYNGLDIDDVSSSSLPDSATGDGNLAKLWLQELQQPLDGAGLPCAVSAVGISLGPPSATNPIGSNHTVNAHLTDPVGAPLPGVAVTFTVQSGPNAGASGTCSTNANCTSDAGGDVSFTYTGSGGAGTDNIQACFPGSAGQVCSVVVTKTWQAGGVTTTTMSTGTTTTSIPTTPTTIACIGGGNCNNNTSNNTTQNDNNNSNDNVNENTNVNNVNIVNNITNVINDDGDDGPGGHGGGGSGDGHHVDSVLQGVSAQSGGPAQAPGGQLARTGTEMRRLTALGFLVVMIGVLFLLYSVPTGRRRGLQ